MSQWEGGGAESVKETRGEGFEEEKALLGSEALISIVPVRSAAVGQVTDSET